MKITLITGFIFLFFSCQQPKDLGFNLQDDGGVLDVIFTDTFTIQAEVMLLDSVITSNPEIFAVGTYQDPQLGKVTAKAFTQWQPISEDRTLAENPIFDSLVISLDGILVYGDSTKTQTLNVYQLQQAIVDTVFYNNSELAFSPTALGKKTLAADVINQGAIQIRLSDALGQSIFQLYQQGASSNTITQTIKGTAIIPEATDNAAIIGIATLSGNTRLKVYYHAANTTTPLFIDFVPTTAKTFTNVQTNLSGTAIANLSKTQPVNTKQSNNRGFLQTSLGIVTKLSFPSLKNLTINGKKAIISRAELVIYPVQENIRFLPLPSRLTLIELDKNNRLLKDSDGKTVNVQVDGTDPQGNTNPIDFSYDSRAKEYRAAMTLHVQSILSGEKGESMVISEFLINTLTVGDQVFNPVSFNRATFELNPSDSKRTRLEVFYTVVK